MNIINRIFAILDDDSIVKIPNQKIDKLIKFSEDTKFPEFKNRRIRIVSLLLKVKDRKPQKILRENYYFYEFDNIGMLDKNKHYEQLSIQLEETFFAQNHKVSENIIKYAEMEPTNKISSIQYQWIPTTGITEELKRQVFKKLSN